MSLPLVDAGMVLGLLPWGNLNQGSGGYRYSKGFVAVCGGCLRFLGWGIGCSSPNKGLESPLYVGNQKLTSPGAVWAEALVVTDAVEDGSECMEAV